MFKARVEMTRMKQIVLGQNEGRQMEGAAEEGMNSNKIQLLTNATNEWSN